jgi:protein TonB
MSVHRSTAAHVRANLEGHLALRVDGQHPADIPFLFEQSHQRAAPAAIASGVGHAVLALLVVLLGRSSLSNGASPADVVDRFQAPLVWYYERGPGGGGGGSGNGMPEPARLAHRPGDDSTTVPVAKRVALQLSAVSNPIDVLQDIVIPASSFASAQDSLPGAIMAPAAPTLSQGPGTGNGAGTGEGTGVGPGKGRGLGPGSGENSGGDTYRPGSGIVSPRVLKELKPQYTADAMRARVQGTVLVACVVRADGTVGSVQIVRSLDPTFGLDEQAIAAVKQWRFAPGTRAGMPVSVQVMIELTFTLR